MFIIRIIGKAIRNFFLRTDMSSPRKKHIPLRGSMEE
jgi:hypothetical protein